MTDDNTVQNNIKLSTWLRRIALTIVLVMVALALISQVTTPAPTTDEDNIEATVQSGVDAQLTSVLAQTGTPEPTAIQATIDARVNATLTAIPAATQAAEEAAAPPESVPAPLVGVWNFFAGLWSGFAGVIGGMWNFVGRAGIFAQLLCCIVPTGLIVLGIVND